MQKAQLTRCMRNVILVSGPTASGKTAFAINLVHCLRKKFGIESEIINADSVQIYEDLRVISSRPTEDELSQAKHNLFGILKSNESNSVSSWLSLADKEICRLSSENKIAIVCGGTGFYLKALIEGISEIPQIPAEVCKAVLEKFNELGRDQFFDELALIDPSSGAKLHKNDTQRILRAYEVVYYTGKSLQEWWNQAHPSEKSETQYNNVVSFFVLMPEKTEIHERALYRIRKMLENGAVKEVARFNNKFPEYSGALKKAIGYREITKMLQNEYISAESYQQCIDEMFLNTKHYIKRQRTWLRNQFPNAKFISKFGDEADVENLLQSLEITPLASSLSS